MIMDDLIKELFNLDDNQLDEFIEWMEGSAIDAKEFSDFVKEQVEGLDTFLWKLDIFSLLLEYICNRANVPELIEYIDSDKEYTAFKVGRLDVGKILSTVPLEDRTPSWHFLIDNFDLDVIDNISEESDE